MAGNTSETMLDRHAIKAVLGGIERGETSAFDNLVSDRASTLYALALRILGDPGSASEAVQQTFVDIRRDALAGEAGWDLPDLEFYSILRRHAFELAGRSDVNPAGIPQMEMTDPVRTGTASFELLQLLNCLGQMSDACREVVTNGFFDVPGKTGIAAPVDDAQGLWRRCYAEYHNASAERPQTMDRDLDLLAMQQALGGAPVSADAGQATLRRGWELRFAPLAELLVPLDPPSDVLDAVKARVQTEASAERTIETGRRTEIWRAVLYVAVAAVAAIMIYFALVAIGDDAAARTLPL